MTSEHRRLILSTVGLVIIVSVLVLTTQGYGAGKAILPRQNLLHIVLGASLVGHLLVALGNRGALRGLALFALFTALLTWVLLLMPPMAYDPDDPPGPLNYLAADAERFPSIGALRAIEQAGLFAGQKASIVPRGSQVAPAEGSTADLGRTVNPAPAPRAPRSVHRPYTDV